jgi:hypothetical protein
MAILLTYQGKLRNPQERGKFARTLHDLAEAANWQHEHVETKASLGLIPSLHQELFLPLVVDREGIFVNPRKRKDRHTISIDTQRAGVEAHKSAVGLLDFVRSTFAPELVITDTSGYFDERDERMLAQRMEAVKEDLRLIVRDLRKRRRFVRLLPEETLVDTLFSVIRTPEDLRVAQRPLRMNRVEEEVLREQEATLFSSDGIMRGLFDGKFEDYWKALRNPKYMERRISEREEELLNLLAHQDPGNRGLKLFAEQARNFAHGVSREENEPTGTQPFVDKEPLYQAADTFAHVTHELMHELYYEKRRKEKHVFRAYVNSIMVPSTLADAYFAQSAGSPAGENEELLLLEQGRTFLRRTLESLQVISQQTEFAHVMPIVSLLVQKGTLILRSLEERITSRPAGA